MRWRKDIVVVLAAAALVTSGCGTTRTPSAERPETLDDRSASSQARENDGTGTQTRVAAGDESGSGGGESDAEKTTEAAGSAGSTAGESSEADALATGSAEIADAATDRTGTGPGYTEITRAAINGRPDAVTFTVEVADDFPKHLPEGTNMIVGIGVQEDSEHAAVAVIAQGTTQGWAAVAQGDRGSRPVSEFKIQGSTMTWTIPWDWVGGPRSFEWGASLKLFDFGAETGQGLDNAPNAGVAPFPQT